MQRVQEIEVHADAEAKTTVYISFDMSGESFGSEIVIVDQNEDPNGASKVDFGSDFDTASDAFEAALHWLAKWSAARNLPILSITNLHDCALISVPEQVLVARRCGMKAPVTGPARSQGPSRK